MALDAEHIANIVASATIVNACSPCATPRQYLGKSDSGPGDTGRAILNGSSALSPFNGV
ncbi:MAG: hypothetical protein KJP07_23975 [Desulfatitalea sp.]|nr:hypothetical protein [Desulfatitalea sp.]